MLSRRSILKCAALSLSAPMINRGRFSLFAKGTAEYSIRTLDLVHRSTVIDMLGLLTLDYRKLSAWDLDPSKFRQVDFLRLKASGITVFHPAVGFIAGEIYTNSLKDVVRWNAFIAAHGDRFQRIDKATDFKQAKGLRKIGILIGQQNSTHFRTIADVDRFHNLGQRVSQLTYTGNRLGGGSSDSHDVGLNSYGVQIVERMNTVGMAVDLSHCGDRTTMDAIDASRKPVLVTHSNCRALVPGMARCKTDEANTRMASKGGVMGITMIRAFVSAAGRVTIEHVLDHIDHLAKLAGVEHVGIGSDVDLNGRDTPVYSKIRFDLDGMDYANKIYELTEGLVSRNYSNRSIELILGGNFERVLGETWS